MNASTPRRYAWWAGRTRTSAFADDGGSSAEGDELLLTLLRPDRDQPVALPEREGRAGTIDPARSALDGQHEHPRLRLDLQVLQRVTVGARATLHHGHRARLLRL